MHKQVKNTNDQVKTPDTNTQQKSMKGNSISEESMDILKKKETKEVAESPVEKENKK